MHSIATIFFNEFTGYNIAKIFGKLIRQININDESVGYKFPMNLMSHGVCFFVGEQTVLHTLYINIESYVVTATESKQSVLNL